mmetsp:Transcript_14870/g.31504  ORF Transcript_14870/g.31504 Transcript_14870/m.31504 type:complete len:225 (-) Transcript_14870:213-887(-)
MESYSTRTRLETVLFSASDNAVKRNNNGISSFCKSLTSSPSPSPTTSPSLLILVFTSSLTPIRSNSAMTTLSTKCPNWIVNPSPLIFLMTRVTTDKNSGYVTFSRPPNSFFNSITMLSQTSMVKSALAHRKSSISKGSNTALDSMSSCKADLELLDVVERRRRRRMRPNDDKNILPRLSRKRLELSSFFLSFFPSFEESELEDSVLGLGVAAAAMVENNLVLAS